MNSNKNRNCKVFFRTTQEEFDLIQQRMQIVGTRNLSAYCRKMVLNGYSIYMDLCDVKEILRLLKINSNNLNQYVKKANETGSIYEEDITGLRQQQKDILQMMGKVLDQLTGVD